MANTQMNLNTAMSPHKLTVNDEMSASITNAIDHLASDGTFFTRVRLRGARSREALKLAETALKESMAAKNRTFVVAVGLAVRDSPSIDNQTPFVLQKTQIHLYIRSGSSIGQRFSHILSGRLLYSTKASG